MIAADSRRTVARRVGIDCVTDVCSFVDELDPAAAGELVVAGDASGTVFVQAARICWAAAHGMARRLTELLVERSAVDAQTMEAYYRLCAAERTPLGEYLVAHDIVSAADLRSALAQHTVESITHLTGPGRYATWVPRPRGGYSPRFTFGTGEVLARSQAAAIQESAALAGAELARCFAGGEWGAAYTRASARGAPAPVALQGDAPESASALLRLGRWAATALDLVEAFDGADAVVSVQLPPRRRPYEALVAFRHADLLIAGEAFAACPARLLNRRARLRGTRG